MNIEVQPELDNQIKNEISSFYKCITVSQQGTLPSFTSSRNQLLIEIPSNIVFNPSLLSISFTRGEPSVVDAAFQMIPSFYIPYFSRIELYTSGNSMKLVDIQNLDNYNKASIGLYESFQKNQDTYLYQSKRRDLTKTKVNDYYLDSDIIADRLVGYANYESSISATVIPARTINIKLCDLCPQSFFCINKNIYSSTILYLRLETNSINNIIFNAVDDGATSSVSAATSIPITNLLLNVYCEANNDLINIAKMQQNNNKSGLELVLSEVQNSQYSISNSAGTRGSITKIVNSSSQNARLYMIISTLTNTTNIATRYNILNNMSNKENKKYNQVQLYLDSNQLCNFDTTLNNDLTYIDNTFENHSFNSVLSYKNISPFVYCFTTKKIKDNKISGNLLEGVPFPQNGELSLNITYNCVNPVANDMVNPTVQTAFTQNIFCITRRLIYCKNGQFSYIPFA